MNRIGAVKDKNILFLQGPMGYFFRDLDCILRKKGANTFKIALNAADWFFSNRDTVHSFKGKKEAWSGYIETFLKEKKIDKIFLFGDCRFYQMQAVAIAMDMHIEIFVFEEGYVRPDFVTMEKHGVNNFSKISRDPAFYMALDDRYLTLEREVLPANPKYRRMAFSATTYYLISHLFSFYYPHYVHHRDPNAIKEFFWGWRNIFRKMKYKFTEKGLTEKLTGTLSKRYYFVPLQTHNDFQLREHSSYSSIEDFIVDVMHSFGEHAPKETFLVLKHHPADRGRKNYEALIATLSKKLGIEERVMAVHDLHLPSCLQNALGTITINSTVGLSSLFHKTATIALGDAIYDIEGLTAKGRSLDDFWSNLEKPDKILHARFRNYLIETTQLNGSFYGRIPVEFFQSEMYR